MSIQNKSLAAAVRIIKDGLGAYPAFSELVSAEISDIQSNIDKANKIVTDDAQTRAM